MLVAGSDGIDASGEVVPSDGALVGLAATGVDALHANGIPVLNARSMHIDRLTALHYLPVVGVEVRNDGHVLGGILIILSLERYRALHATNLLVNLIAELACKDGVAIHILEEAFAFLHSSLERALEAHAVSLSQDAFSIQQLKSDTTLYNQVSSKEMFAYFIDGKIHETQAKDNVLIGYFFEEGDSVAIIYNYQETTEMRMFLKDRKLQKVWTPKSSGTMYPLNQIPNDRKHLPGFAWYNYVRPMNRYDIFNWREKKSVEN